MKFLLVNWTKKEEQKGGCETLFSNLDKILKEMGHETRFINFDDAKTGLAMEGMKRENTHLFEVEGSHIIDRYCRNYLKFSPETHIISNAGIVNIWYKHKNVTNIYNDPYDAIVKKIMRYGMASISDLNRYCYINTILQKWGSLGASNIAISNFMVSEMKKLDIIPDKIIFHGVDTEMFKPFTEEKKYYLREKYGIPNDMKVAIWSKDFNPTSGFNILSELIKKHKDVFWILQFKNEMNSRYKAKNVKIMKPIDYEKMPEMYNMADFCVNCSIAESFGMVPLEAMACGVPCVMTNTGFVWEENMMNDVTKRDYGYLVNRWEKISFSNAIQQLLESKKINPRTYAEQFNMENWKKNWKSYIEDL